MISYYHKNIRSKNLQKLEKYKAGSWVYVESPNEDDLKVLMEDFKLDEGLLEDAMDQDEMPRIEKENGLVYLYSRFPYRAEDGAVTTSPFLMVIGQNVFITISHTKISRIEKFLQEKIEFYTTQRSRLALQILDQVVEQYEFYLGRISRQITSIRSRLRVETIRNKDFIDFVIIEDQLNEFLSMLSPTNAILRRILLGKHLQLYEKDEDLVEDLLLNNEQSIAVCKGSIKSMISIREAYSTIMTNNLNSVIRLLTILTVTLSVPTLIASIYGMNVALPFADSEYAFIFVAAISVLVTTSFVALFRYKRWF